MKNPITESFWDSLTGYLSISFASLKVVSRESLSSIIKTEELLIDSYKKIFDKAVPAIQVQAVEALMSLDMESENHQWEVLEEIFREEKNFDHLRSAFDEYISTYALYVHELLPHQKTMLIKKAIELYPEIDRISFNV